MRTSKALSALCGGSAGDGPAMVATELCDGNTPLGARVLAEALACRLRAGLAPLRDERGAPQGSDASPKRSRKRNRTVSFAADSVGGAAREKKVDEGGEDEEDEGEERAQGGGGDSAGAGGGPPGLPPPSDHRWLAHQTFRTVRRIHSIWRTVPPGGAMVVVLQGPSTLATVLDRLSLSTGPPWGKPRKQEGEEALDPAVARSLESRGEALVLFPAVRKQAFEGQVCVLLKQ